ncbi:MAG: hypothetical protein GQ574_25700 [Crocinitomix sp.]|nr:hypothetical protein [Crocinitomix sp.]
MKIFYTFLAISLFSQFSFAQCEDFDVELTFTDPLCPDYADGSVTALPIGGELPYIILITDSDGTIHNTDGGSETGNYLLEGWYYIDVTDDMGCTFVDSVLLVDPLQINVDDYTIVEPSALEVCDGSITIDEVSGDYDNLFYAWTPDPDDISGIDANSMTDACAGTYDLVIVNEVGCSMSYEYEIGFGLSITDNILDQVVINNTIQGIYIAVETQDQSALRFQITDLSGKIILTSDISNGESFIDFNRDGFFICSIIDENGLLRYQEKISR